MSVARVSVAILLVFVCTKTTRANTINHVSQEEIELGELQKSYSQYQLLRVHPKDGKQLWAVLALAQDSDDVTVWNTHNRSTIVDVLCAPKALDRVRKVLSTEKIRFEVAIADLQTAITEANPQPDPEYEDWENRQGHRLTWRRFHRYKDIESYLEYLAWTYPEICQVEVIGNSSEGRELKVLKVSSGGEPKPAIFVDGGIHAREWISPATVTYLLLQLVEFREHHPELLNDLDWYFLPVVNPDGYEYTHTADRLWRKTRSMNHGATCVGVDANRNFDYHWMESGSSNQPCFETFAGATPFSEPETKALSDYLLIHKSHIKVYLTLHSYGQMWLVPYGYTGVKPPDYYDMYVLAEKAVEALKKTHGTDYLLGSSEELIYISSGGSDDWAKGIAGIKYAYTVELPDTGRHGFILPSSYIEKTGQETWQGIKALAQYYTTNIASTES